MEFITTLALLIVLLANAKLAGEISERLGYNAVLGELLIGFLFGSGMLGLLDVHHEVLVFFAELGALFLLFEIGLESSLTALLKVGARATGVAVIGVTVPFVLGWGLFAFLGYATIEALLVGATLTATSVGITSRVLAEMKQLDTPEGRIILGAAVIDDVIGLLILSVIVSLMQGTAVSLLGITSTLAITTALLMGIVLVGVAFVPHAGAWLGKLRTKEGAFCLSVFFAGALGILANSLGLAVIVGAFIAGLLLARTPLKEKLVQSTSSASAFFVPFFFLLAGAHVSPEAFLSWHSLLFIGGIFLIACIGKIVSGIAARGVASPWVVGVGMIPRGEVGLIFAQYGLTYSIIGAEMYALLVTVVVLTTFVTPIALKMLYAPISSR